METMSTGNFFMRALAKCGGKIKRGYKNYTKYEIIEYDNVF